MHSTGCCVLTACSEPRQPKLNTAVVASLAVSVQVVLCIFACSAAGSDDMLSNALTPKACAHGQLIYVFVSLQTGCGAGRCQA